MLAQSKNAALVAALLQTRSLLLWCGLRLRCMCPIQGAAAAWLHAAWQLCGAAAYAALQRSAWMLLEALFQVSYEAGNG